MAKVIDITEKLNFDENPRLSIKGTEIEVRTDAATVLKIMGAMTQENDIQAVSKCGELLFSEEDMSKIEMLHLSISDFMVLIQTAIDIALNTGEDEPGEAQTRTMT